MQETQVQSLGWKETLEKGLATHYSILAWSIPWTEEPDRLQSMGSQRVWQNWVTKHTYKDQFSSVAQSCPTLCDPVDCSPPGSSVQGILQARILWWVAMLSSRGSSQPRDWTQVSCIAGRFFTNWAKVHFSLLSLGAGTKFPLGIIFHLL